MLVVVVEPTFSRYGRICFFFPKLLFKKHRILIYIVHVFRRARVANSCFRWLVVWKLQGSFLFQHEFLPKDEIGFLLLWGPYRFGHWETIVIPTGWEAERGNFKQHRFFCRFAKDKMKVDELQIERCLGGNRLNFLGSFRRHVKEHFTAPICPALPALCGTIELAAASANGVLQWRLCVLVLACVFGWEEQIL